MKRIHDSDRSIRQQLNVLYLSTFNKSFRIGFANFTKYLKTGFSINEVIVEGPWGRDSWMRSLVAPETNGEFCRQIIIESQSSISNFAIIGFG